MPLSCFIRSSRTRNSPSSACDTGWPQCAGRWGPPPLERKLGRYSPPVFLVQGFYAAWTHRGRSCPINQEIAAHDLLGSLALAVYDADGNHCQWGHSDPGFVLRQRTETSACGVIIPKDVKGAGMIPPPDSLDPKEVPALQPESKFLSLVFLVLEPDVPVGTVTEWFVFRSATPAKCVVLR